MSNSTNSTSPATAPPTTNSSSSSNSTTTAASPPPQSPLPPSSPPPKSSSPPPSSTPTGKSSDQSPPDSPPPPTKSSDGSQSQSSSSSPPPPPPPPSPPGVTHSLAPPAPKLSSGSRSLGPPSSGSPSSNKSEAMVAAGGAFAAFILFALILCVCYCCRKKKKIDKPHNNMQYYNDTSGFQGNNYFMSGPDSQWMPESSFGKPPLYPSNPGGWQPQPPPPLPLMTSANMSSGGFSGPHGPPLPPPSPNVALGFDKSTFTYEELASATNNFNDENLLGQGGFGYVHKGWLPNGKEIAVKQLKSGSGQGEREFQAEVDIISRVHHKHLVSLVGYCIAGAQRMLVYDFVPNNTLEFHLHSGPADKKVPVIDWPTRLKIAHGAAKGIAYLHEDCHPRIIHRDIKASNILLDENFEAMVADFGLAKLSADNHTHVSTRVMGTFGYLAPEYASSGKLTEKSDVYSYGVMLLEMITGRRPVDMNHAFMDDSLVDWARPVLGLALADGNYDDLADPRLQGNYDPMEMARMVASAAAAVRHSAKRRPKMSQIVRALEGEVSLEDLNEGMRPGQSTNFGSGSDFESSSYASNMRTKMRQVQMASPEYSGDYSEPVTGYARNSEVSSSDGEYSSQLKPNPRVRNL